MVLLVKKDTLLMNLLSRPPNSVIVRFS
jgi:hypothetical protein